MHKLNQKAKREADKKKDKDARHLNRVKTTYNKRGQHTTTIIRDREKSIIIK